jgi:hypothetical protein
LQSWTWQNWPFYLLYFNIYWISCLRSYENNQRNKKIYYS